MSQHMILFYTYRSNEQQKARLSLYTFAQTRQSLQCIYTQRMGVDKGSGQIKVYSQNTFIFGDVVNMGYLVAGN